MSETTQDKITSVLNASIEQTKAVEELTQEVGGKITEIDKAKDDAINEINSKQSELQSTTEETLSTITEEHNSKLIELETAKEGISSEVSTQLEASKADFKTVLVNEAIAETITNADRAELARDAASLSAGMFESAELGLAGTSSGEFFSVPLTGLEDALILFKHNDAGNATEIVRYPSSKLVDKLVGYINETVDVDEIAFAFVDEFNQFSLGITKDGKILANHFQTKIIEHLVDDADDLVYSIEDSLGNVVLGIDSRGNIYSYALEVIRRSVLSLEYNFNKFKAELDSKPTTGVTVDLPALERKAWAALAEITAVNGTVVVVGDSITVGVGASDQTNLSWWGRLMAGLTGVNGENLNDDTSKPHLNFLRRATSGTSSADWVDSASLTSITAGSYGVYMIALGTNDIYNSSTSTTPDVYEGNIRTIINAIRSNNSDSKIILVIPAIAVESQWAPVQHHSLYAARLRKLAKEYDCLLSDDSGLNLNDSYDDGVHPDDSGHLAMYINRLNTLTLI